MNNKRLFTFAKVLLFWFGTMIILAAASAATKSVAGIWTAIASLSIALAGSVLLTLLFVRWEGLTLKSAGILPESQSFGRLLSGFLIGLLLPFLQAMLVLASGHVTLTLSPQISLLIFAANLLLFLMIAFREEVAFRGFPLRALERSAGKWLALILITILFIIEHRISGWTWPRALIGSGLGGLLYGLATLKTRGIALSAGLHSAWNFGQWLLGFKDDTGLYQVYIEKGYEARAGQAGWLGYLLAVGLAILFFIIIELRSKKTAYDQHP
ncbi:MAG: CPBP family glutamic-type intramembrane protease [Bacteroidota bacterium]